MQLSVYLNFNGRCEEAFKFFERTLGGKITTMNAYEGTPMEEQVPKDWRKKVLHAELVIGPVTLMGSDAPAEHFHQPQGFSISIQTDQPAEAERLFHALAENGQIQMPIGPTYWAARFGMLVDQFGIPWMVNCSQAASASSGR
jgi:PhnB protein